MVRRGSFKCTVPGCTSEWMLASFRRLQYCVDHHYVALDVYNRYKKATSNALKSFKTEDLIEAIQLRKEYDFRFVGGDKGSHATFIKLLEYLLEVNISNRKQTYDKLVAKFNKKY
jgi:hypothetical protein